MKYFDRYKSMSSKTFHQIGLILKQDELSHQLENYMYGLYDGYNYSEEILQLAEMEKLKEVRPVLYASIIKVLEEVNLYPEA
jgi:hypothetical protein